MKRSFKIFLLACLVASTICTILVLFEQAGHLTPHHRRAKDPNFVREIVETPLPHIYHTDTYNAPLKDRPEWICFSHTAHFAEPLKKATYKELDSLCNAKSEHWSKNSTEECYQYTDDAYNRGKGYSILCHIYTDHSYVEYCVDKSMYTIPKFIFATIIAITIFTIITWGVTLLFTQLNRWANAE